MLRDLIDPEFFDGLAEVDPDRGDATPAAGYGSMDPLAGLVLEDIQPPSGGHQAFIFKSGKPGGLDERQSRYNCLLTGHKRATSGLAGALKNQIFAQAPALYFSGQGHKQSFGHLIKNCLPV